MTLAYHLVHHPCWSNKRTELWERIHLPVAKACNVKCSYCQSQNSSCHIPMPGSCQDILGPEESLIVLSHYLEKKPNLRIVGFAGPGDPLFNEETFETIELVRDSFPEMRLCLSTNGILLEKNVKRLEKLEVSTISVSMSSIRPTTASKIYEWAFIDGKISSGFEMAKDIIDRQVRGIVSAKGAGIHVKVNTILIPKLNSDEVVELAATLANLGVDLQNILPLVPLDCMSSMIPPTFPQLLQARKDAGVYLKQFVHCHQCRSDVVGIPGKDDVLDLGYLI